MDRTANAGTAFKRSVGSNPTLSATSEPRPRESVGGVSSSFGRGAWTSACAVNPTSAGCTRAPTVSTPASFTSTVAVNVARSDRRVLTDRLFDGNCNQCGFADDD